MGKGFVKNHNFSRALQTKALDDGLPLPDFVTFANARVSNGAAEARTGMVRVAKATSTTKAQDFTAASSEYLAGAVDTRVWTLGTKFTLEVVVSLDDKTLTNTVLYAGSTTPSIVVDTASNKWRVRFWDSAATLTTLTTTADALESDQSLQVIRDGSSLVLRVDNGTETSGSVDASLLSRAPVGDLRVARGASSDYLDGTVDYIRLYSLVRSDHADRLVRMADPLASYVLCDYDMNATGDALIRDRSRFENTLAAYNTPTEVTGLCHQSPGVDGVASYRDANNKRQVVTVVGGRYHHAESNGYAQHTHQQPQQPD